VFTRCSNGRDLNRDFPDRFTSATMEASGNEQPETAAMMEWTKNTGFVASASMHEVGGWARGVGPGEGRGAPTGQGG